MKAIAGAIAAGVDVRLPHKEFAFVPTPTRSDGKNRGSPMQLARSYIPLSCRLRILPDGRFDASGGRANPEFVEWLMGWPTGWSDLERSATDRYRSWLLAHSSIFRSGSGGGDS
jgi:DNA (cytosine-5)-methyltransferase 1